MTLMLQLPTDLSMAHLKEILWNSSVATANVANMGTQLAVTGGFLRRIWPELLHLPLIAASRNRLAVDVGSVVLAHMKRQPLGT